MDSSSPTGINVPDWTSYQPVKREKESKMKIIRVGVDLAKNVFQVHGVDEHARRVFNRQIKLAHVMEFFARLQPCMIGMEACASAHYWARKLSSLGHTVKLMPPQYVKSYVKTNKNDAIDAEAICEAVSRPNMRFVAPKSVDQQAVTALHALRCGAMKARNATANRLRGLLLEFGITIPKGVAYVSQRVPDELEDAGNELPSALRIALQDEYEQFKALEQRLQRLQAQITQWHREHAASQVLEKIPGVGVLTATALVAGIGDAAGFANGRQVSAWIGIVPKQHSSGGKIQLLGISKHGDSYLRTLLIHGARSVVSSLKRRLAAGENPATFTSTQRWLIDLLQRRNANVAAVALANKNARTAWALLAHAKPYEPGHVSVSPRARAGLVSTC
jgi:transposase